MYVDVLLILSFRDCTFSKIDSIKFFPVFTLNKFEMIFTDKYTEINEKSSVCSYLGVSILCQLSHLKNELSMLSFEVNSQIESKKRVILFTKIWNCFLYSEIA